MYYVVLVSHGNFAPGLHTAVKMIAGNNENVFSLGLQDGLGADEFGTQFDALTKAFSPEDRIVLLADIIGGSPLTTAMNKLAERGLLAVTTAVGGMSLPMALTAVLMGESMDDETLVNSLLQESKEAIAPFVLDIETDSDDDI